MRFWSILSGLVFAIAATMSFATPADADDIRPVANDNLCLDVDMAQNRVILYACHGGQNQTFFTRAWGRQEFNGKCLDADARSEAPLVMRDCRGNPTQAWVMSPAPRGGGSVQLKNDAGWCVDVPRGNAAQMQALAVYGCHTGDNQAWTVRGTAPIAGSCDNAELTQAIVTIAGRRPRANGSTGECDPTYYANAGWSSNRDLLNKVKVKLTGGGAAYVFIAPKMAFLQGHVGWAYTNYDGSYTYGATDAPNVWTGMVGKGRDTNTPWLVNGEQGVAQTEAELFRAFKGHYDRDTYNEVKHTFVASRNLSAPRDMAQFIRNNGYGLVGNNCADHTYWMLQAYGVETGRVMRSLSDRPAPNSWFRAFGTMQHDGSILQAVNTPGEAI